MTQKQRIDFEQRREQILDAVSSLFAEKGLAVTTKELAAAAGVSEALIYKHFKSKEELFTGVKERCCQGAHSVAEIILAKDSAKERVTLSMLLLCHAKLEGFEDDLLEKEEMYRLILQSLIAEGDFALQMFTNFGQWIPQISKDLVIAREEGVLKEMPSTDEQLLWMVHHFLLGMAITKIPEQKLGIFPSKIEDLVEGCALQALVMIGMNVELAKTSIKEVLGGLSENEYFKSLNSNTCSNTKE